MNCKDIIDDVDSLLQNPEDLNVYKRLEAHFKECDTCREEHGEIINTAAKLSEVGQISDIVDMSDKFIVDTKKEAERESDKHKIGSIRKEKVVKQKRADYVILALLIMTILIAIAIFFLAFKYL